MDTFHVRVRDSVIPGVLIQPETTQRCLISCNHCDTPIHNQIILKRSDLRCAMLRAAIAISRIYSTALDSLGRRRTRLGGRPEDAAYQLRDGLDGGLETLRQSHALPFVWRPFALRAGPAAPRLRPATPAAPAPGPHAYHVVVRARFHIAGVTKLDFGLRRAGPAARPAPPPAAPPCPAASLALPSVAPRWAPTARQRRRPPWLPCAAAAASWLSVDKRSDQWHKWPPIPLKLRFLARCFLSVAGNMAMGNPATCLDVETSIVETELVC